MTTHPTPDPGLVRVASLPSELPLPGRRLPIGGLPEQSVPRAADGTWPPGLPAEPVFPLDLGDRSIAIGSCKDPKQLEPRPDAAECPELQTEGTAGDGSLVRSARLLPPWLVSFLLHLTLLTTLAGWTRLVDPASSIQLEAAMTTEQGLDPMEIRLDPVAAGGAAGSAASEEQLAMEPEVLPLEILETGPMAAWMREADLQKQDGDGLWGTQHDDGRDLGIADALAGQGTESGEPGQKASFFGISARGKRFVFIVDCSGSMGGPPWIAARNELIRTLRELQPDQLFSVMLYSSEAWSPEGRVSEAAFWEATPENLEKITVWLNRQVPGGGTLPLPALRESLRLIPDAVFLLSDGQLQDDSRGYLWRYNGRTNGRKAEDEVIPVNTVAIGMSAGAELLGIIARENRGQFQHIW